MFTTLGNAVFALLFTISTLATIILFAGFGSGLGVIYLVVSLLLALVFAILSGVFGVLASMSFRNGKKHLLKQIDLLK